MWERGYTFRRLLIAYDTRLLTEWDHTAQILSSLNVLQCIVMNLAGKSKARPRPPSYFHPYRENISTGMVVRRNNFADLKMIGKALSRG